MILLRWLGRMDEVPLAQIFEDEARILSGKAYDEAAIRTRYGKTLGYWSFYLKTGVARLVAPSRAVRESTAVSNMPASMRTPH
jgi:hypothetical protein